MSRPIRFLAAVAAIAVLTAACSSSDNEDVAAPGSALGGLLRITAGECADAGVTTGSSFRMVQPDGTVAGGPFVENGDSTCGDVTWTAMSPGADGGLTLGGFQPNPDPAFDDGGNALSDRIIAPVAWFGVKFAAATNETDPQTGTATKVPSLTVEGGSLTGDLSAFAAAWNGQHFNQGAPKPDGSSPGNTATASGTYDAATGAITVEWASQIEGGPFDRFTGVWRLEGTVEAT